MPELRYGLLLALSYPLVVLLWQFLWIFPTLPFVFLFLSLCCFLVLSLTFLLYKSRREIEKDWKYEIAEKISMRFVDENKTYYEVLSPKSLNEEMVTLRSDNAEISALSIEIYDKNGSWIYTTSAKPPIESIIRLYSIRKHVKRYLTVKEKSELLVWMVETEKERKKTEFRVMKASTDESSAFYLESMKYPKHAIAMHIDKHEEGSEEGKHETNAFLKLVALLNEEQPPLVYLWNKKERESVSMENQKRNSLIQLEAKRSSIAEEENMFNRSDSFCLVFRSIELDANMVLTTRLHNYVECLEYHGHFNATCTIMGFVRVRLSPEGQIFYIQRHQKDYVYLRWEEVHNGDSVLIVAKEKGLCLQSHSFTDRLSWGKGVNRKAVFFLHFLDNNKKFTIRNCYYPTRITSVSFAKPRLVAKKAQATGFLRLKDFENHRDNLTAGEHLEVCLPPSDDTLLIQY